MFLFIQLIGDLAKCKLSIVGNTSVVEGGKLNSVAFLLCANSGSNHG